MCVRQKGIFLKHLSLHKQNNKYFRIKIADLKNTDISDMERETINNDVLDVLCQSGKEFYCCICRHHPLALVMDLNRKNAFKMSLNEINRNNENDEVIDLDEVNMDEFWKKVK